MVIHRLLVSVAQIHCELSVLSKGSNCLRANILVVATVLFAL